MYLKSISNASQSKLSVSQAQLRRSSARFNELNASQAHLKREVQRSSSASQAQVRRSSARFNELNASQAHLRRRSRRSAHLKCISVQLSADQCNWRIPAHHKCISSASKRISSEGHLSPRGSAHPIASQAQFKRSSVYLKRIPRASEAQRISSASQAKLNTLNELRSDR